MAIDLVAAWKDAGTRLVFGVPGGGSNLDVVGAVQACGMRFVLAHTENAAAIMAGVVGELTGSPGACVVTRGPGIASAVNGVAQALLDRQPMILVSDCVAVEVAGAGRPNGSRNA
jgi:acetolactate synthase I/II/III large subunit